MLYIPVLLTLAGIATALFDEELNAKYQTMESSKFIDHFNEQNYTWKMKDYSSNYLSNIHFNYTAFNFRQDNKLGELKHRKGIIIPDNFDSRTKWASCPTIGQIYEQHFCSSCWAHGVANTASDRICIHTGKVVELSEQDLECSHPSRTICEPGNPIEGFQFWLRQGIVTRSCKLYEPQNLIRRQCVLKCHNRYPDYHRDKHFAEKVYPLPKDDYYIKAELFLNGPIQATMKIYEDFQNFNGKGYLSGIYEYKYGKYITDHSVRIIGYGVENGIDYWLVANSWGRQWGEKGFFRIKRSQKVTEFDNLYCGLPKK